MYNSQKQKLFEDARIIAFKSGASQRLTLAKEQIQRETRAYIEGQMDARMVGKSARDISVARTLYHDDGAAAVCYLNGVDDTLATS